MIYIKKNRGTYRFLDMSPLGVDDVFVCFQEINF